MSDFSTLYSGLTQEQQLYLQQQNARLMMIRSMNQSSSGSSPSLHSSQSAVATVSTSNPQSTQSLQAYTIDASPPKVAPTGYYLRRQGDAQTVQASRTLSQITNVPYDGKLGQGVSESHVQIHDTQLLPAQEHTDLQQQRELQQQIQQLQRLHQARLQEQQPSEQQTRPPALQVQHHSSQQIFQPHRETEIISVQTNAPPVEQQQQQQQQQRQWQQNQQPQQKVFNSTPAPAATLDHLDPPNLLSLLHNPDPSLTFSTFVVFWRQTAHTRREIISKLPARQSQTSVLVKQQSSSPRFELSDNSVAASPSVPSASSSNVQSQPKALELFSLEPEPRVANAAYFKEYSSATGSEEDVVMQWLQDLTGLLIFHDSQGRAIVGRSSHSDSMHQSLRSGVVLCQAANKIVPNSVPKISMQEKPFNQRENISAFINFLRRVGVAEKDLFGTEDLFEGKNTRQVVISLMALGRALYKVPNYSGPSPCRPETLRRRSTFEVRQDGLWGKAGGQFGQVRPRT